MQRADIEFSERRAQVFGQALHDALVFQPQDQIARVALEAGADDAMFLGGGLERFQKRILAFRGFRDAARRKSKFAALLPVPKTACA